MKYCKLLSDYKLFLPFLFILNLVGNGVWLFIQPSVLSVILVIVLSALFAVLEVLLFRIIPTSFLKAVYAVILIILHNVVGIVDYFLLYHFGSVIDLYVLNTVLLTNEGEASEFANTYITIPTIVVFFVAVVLVNVIAYKLASYLSKLRYTLWTIRIAALLSIVFLVVNSALFVLFNISANAQTPMHQAFLRVGREYARFRLGIHIDELLKACQEVKAVSTLGEPLKMIVIIGESHSVYHTSLYGYEKETYPLLQEGVKKGELFVMQQAVSAHDVTSPAMWSIFSLDSMGVNTNQTPFFPAVFKAAGYRTFMYDNEFLKNDMLHVMTNSTLSDAMYDQRNTHYYKYDIDMINDLPMPKDSLAMYILHLAGHHFEYCNRYPKEFDKFKSEGEEKGFVKSDEDALTYALYPPIAPKFLKGEAEEEELKAPHAFTEDEAIGIPTQYNVEVDGDMYEVKIMPTGFMEIEETASGNFKPVEGGVTSSMQGMVIKLSVNVGDKVTKGSTICVIEAMKMENDIQSEVDGEVMEIFVEPGDAVSAGDTLMVIK